MKKFRTYIFLSLGLAANLVLQAQPTISWQNCFGGSSSEGAKGFIKTSDGGLLALGKTYSNDGDVSGMHFWYDSINSMWFSLGDCWVLKLDSNHTIQWQRCLGGSNTDLGLGAVETTDGYLLLCTTASADGDVSVTPGPSDYWVVKLDYSGTIIWEKTYGGSYGESAQSIEATPDGGFILAGATLSNDGDVTGNHGNHDIWIVKIDSVGNIIWQKTLGGSNAESYAKAKVDAIGNVYVVGLARSIDGNVSCSQVVGRAWLIKLDLNGSIIWQKCFGGTGADGFYNLDLKGDKLVMTGATTSVDGDLNNNYGYYDAWVVLTDTSGTIIFSKNYGGSVHDEMIDVKFTNNYEIIAGGYSYSNDNQVTMNHTPKDCWLICIDSIGTLVWQNSYGGSDQERIDALLAPNDGSLYFAGETASPNNGDVTGHHAGMSQQSDFWIVKLNAPVGIEENNAAADLNIYPNPFYTTFNISFKTPIDEPCSIYVYDAMGRKVQTVQEHKLIATNNLYLTVNANAMPSGLYYVTITSPTGAVVKKVVKL